MYTRSLYSALLFSMAIAFFSCAKEPDKEPDDDPIETCVKEENVFSGQFDGKKYEFIKQAMNWRAAASCAVERGGYLVEINSSSEQGNIYSFALGKVDDLTASVSPDGGDATYFWLGGNDFAVNGNWIWDGDNDGTGAQFWEGKSNGKPVDNLYSNWGNEPDDFQGQNALGMALTNWQNGSAGKWNDVQSTNILFFVIEYD